jgi:hypothetical protein
MAYGTLEALMPFCRANNVSATDVPAAGTVLAVPGEVDGAEVPIDEDALNYIYQNNILIGTAALPTLPPLSLRILLKPDMEVYVSEPTSAMVLGYFNYQLRGTSGFINEYPLEAAYPGSNKVRHKDLHGLLTGALPLFEVGLPFGTPAMPDKTIQYHLPWDVSLGYGIRVIWNSPDSPVKTVTFKDVEGNEAYISPLYALNNAIVAPQQAAQYVCGNISAALVSATATVAKIRLTRSHPPISWVTTGIEDDVLTVTGLGWLGIAGDGEPDPSDPTNTNKVIITVPAGKYTVGVKANYNWSDMGTPPGGVTLPSSYRTMVIEVANL